jgi:hypothetical protein
LPGYGPRGGDIDRNGVFWASLASGHLASFDRRKCKVLNGPTATGKHCPEGWTLHQFPGPQFKDLNDPGSAEASYYTWIDQFDTLGLGKNVPIASGNLNDSMLALVDGNTVDVHREPLVFRRIDRLVRLHIFIPLAVAVSVEDERRPALRLHLVAGFLEHLPVQPADHIAATPKYVLYFVLMVRSSLVSSRYVLGDLLLGAASYQLPG